MCEKYFTLSKASLENLHYSVFNKAAWFPLCRMILPIPRISQSCLSLLLPILIIPFLAVLVVLLSGTAQATFIYPLF